MSTLSLSLISKYRQELMGFSAVLILACHSVGNGVQMPGIIRTILNFGNIGVDMFLFLSGMGLYYSLNSNRWIRLSDWYSRRYKRVLVPYLIIAIPFYIFKVIIGDSGIPDALYDLSTISYWTHHRSAWFLALLLPLYAVTPLFSKIIDGVRCRWIPAIILSFLFIVLSVILKDNHGDIAKNFSFALSRIPCFVTGYWLGKMVQNGDTLNTWIAFFTPVLLFLLLYLCPFPIYCFWLLMFPLMQLLVWFFEHNHLTMRWFASACFFMGTITLESYLTNVYLSSVFRHVDWVLGGVDINIGNYVHYACVLVSGLIWAMVAHKCSEKILRKKTSPSFYVKGD